MRLMTQLSYILLEFCFQQITDSHIINEINSLKNKRSSDVDNLSNVLIKLLRDDLVKPLTFIINQTLNTGIFPRALELSKIIPIHKKGERDMFSNYRLVSLFPTISKKFEKIMYRQLYDYFNENKLISEHQYGFRPQHSTELATLN